MASPVIAGSNFTDGTGATTTPALNLPGSIAAGDLLIVAARIATGADPSWPAGWNEFVASSADGSDDWLVIAWRKADGSEGATVSLTTDSAKFASVSYRITGAADPTVTPPEAATVSTGTSTSPDPPTSTPTGGPKDFLYLVIGSWEGEQTDPPGTFPTGYDSNQQAGQSGTGGAVTTNVRIAGGGKGTTASSSDNPSAFSISVSDDWMCTTIAIHPAEATKSPPFVSGSARRIVPLI